MKNSFAFTHWACFDCRKSFAKEPVAKDTAARKCPQCAQPMTDMGAYFEPPRMANKKRWNVMKILADYGYKFRSEGMKVWIQSQILQTKNPRAVDVIERIEAEKISNQKSDISRKHKNFI
jgi:hypothetical protein